MVNQTPGEECLASTTMGSEGLQLWSAVAPSLQNAAGPPVNTPGRPEVM